VNTMSPRAFLLVGASLLLCGLLGTTFSATAQEAAAPGKVVVSGVVPDESTRQAILAKAREVYGADRVVDQIGVGNLVAPPQWAHNVQKMITPELKRVSRGQLRVSGNVVDVTGEVDNEATRQQVVSLISTHLNPTYTVRNGLRVSAAGQEAVDAALANRIIEFEPGNATLTANGIQVLDQLLPVLKQLGKTKFEVIGHTDGQGSRQRNVALSAARADAVKAYLTSNDVAPELIQTSGVGPDRPVASNDTAEGRARNRRIELRVMQ
jgi:OmpA-OmpF porin, OOP family